MLPVVVSVLLEHEVLLVLSLVLLIDGMVGSQEVEAILGKKLTSFSVALGSVALPRKTYSSS